MKNIVNILTIVTLATTTFPTINSITNTKLNQNINFQQKEVIDLGAKVFSYLLKVMNL